MAVALALPAMSVGFLVCPSPGASIPRMRWSTWPDGRATGSFRPCLATAARTLGDSSVELAYWARRRRGVGQPDGETRSLRARGRSAASRSSSKRSTPRRRHPRPALREQRPFVEAVGAYSLVWQDTPALDAASRQIGRGATRIAGTHSGRAADDERRRIERDLHDGGQQRLVAYASGSSGRGIDGAGPRPHARMLHRLGDDIDAPSTTYARWRPTFTPPCWQRGGYPTPSARPRCSLPFLCPSRSTAATAISRR